MYSVSFTWIVVILVDNQEVQPWLNMESDNLSWRPRYSVYSDHGGHLFSFITMICNLGCTWKATTWVDHQDVQYIAIIEDCYLHLSPRDATLVAHEKRQLGSIIKMYSVSSTWIVVILVGHHEVQPCCTWKATTLVGHQEVQCIAIMDDCVDDFMDCVEDFMEE